MGLKMAKVQFHYGVDVEVFFLSVERRFSVASILMIPAMTSVCLQRG